MSQYPDKEWLYHEYVELNKTRKQLAIECGVSESTIKTHLYEKRIIKRKPLFTYEEIEQAYIKENLTYAEMSSKFDVSENCIRSYVKKYNFPPRQENITESEAQYIATLYLVDKLSTTEIEELTGRARGTITRCLDRQGIERRNLVEAQWNYQDKEYPELFSDYDALYELYINQKMSLKDLGKFLNCDPKVVKRVLTEYNIPLRNNAESKIGLMVGENHPNWQGGITSLNHRCREYFNINLAKKAKQYNNQCSLCGATSNLHVHHKIPFSKIVHQIIDEHPELSVQKNIDELYKIIVTDDRFLNIDNLMVVCKDCHYYKIHGYNKSTSSEDKN